ncbi:hypothetical protein KKR91_01215 [Arthrobacter jiangjiafuii]|uniref:Uncharacterized protein n=1 Tax=Arthrobacter jiangjiafuii TaxID=2817475 RepID=A0A975M5E1_9MICC|nr:hypothetical protein [Arthrobacter jiangjiafuii]MBP3044873.1 hypothetical protein [Arthrobacter jiangjiafuii]QWC10303.1 hypothetical protein KKR91_01215 [Arthrobacter jiangjiafuii]
MSKDPSTYAGEFICAFCGSGWPNCAVTNPATGEKYTHAETCQKYYDARPEDAEAYAMHPECEKRLMEDDK